MEFNQAKEKLKQGYIGMGLEVIEEKEDQVLLSYRRSSFVLSPDDIQGYANFENRRSELQVIPVECSICSTQYREHIVTSLRPFTGFTMYYSKDENITFGEPSQENIYAELGEASDIFCNFFRFEEGLWNRHKMLKHNTTSDVRDIKELFRKPQTCLLYTSPSPRDRQRSRMPSSA